MERLAIFRRPFRIAFRRGDWPPKRRGSTPIGEKTPDIGESRRCRPESHSRFFPTRHKRAQEGKIPQA
jgi:hypothetical protein